MKSLRSAPPKRICFGFKNFFCPRLDIRHLFYILFSVLILVPSLAGAAQVSLTWKRSTGSNIAGYKMHYGNYRGNYQYTVDVGNSTSCTISGLNEGTTYYFAATAYDTQQNESGYSNEVKYAPFGVTSTPVGHNDYCRDFGPCSVGQGDCDTNSECQSGLTCVQVSGTDTCQGSVSTIQGSVSTIPVGHLDYCRDFGPCSAGQGDCDTNSECQSGLTCVQVSGTDTCQGSVSTIPVGHLDYCRDFGPCSVGQGDCDNDSQCQSGLTCVQVSGTDTCQGSVSTIQGSVSTIPVGHFDYCRDFGPCGVGEGDCDTNSECQSGLTCVQVSGTDTCQGSVSTIQGSVSTIPVGHLDYCRDFGPCSVGQGDCDNDSQCQSGLTCVQVSGTDTCQGSVSTIQGSVSTIPVGHLDYCRDFGPCSVGQGDCDNDSQCQSGLTCVQVPGTDTCQGSVSTIPVGHLDYCRDFGPCGEGQGDCDNDSQCQSGLTCVQVSGIDTCQNR